MNIVISDPKTRRAYAKTVESMPFQGKKLGDEVDLSELGLEGYAGTLTGGSDKTGTPMMARFPGTARKKLLVYPGVGFRKGEKGERKKRPLRGNVIANDIHQLNVKLTKYGNMDLEAVLGKPKDSTKEEKAKA